MIQEIITYGIIASTVIYLIYRFFHKVFSGKKQKGCGICEGGDQCAGCPLKNMQSIKEKK